MNDSLADGYPRRSRSSSGPRPRTARPGRSPSQSPGGRPAAAAPERWSPPVQSICTQSLWLRACIREVFWLAPERWSTPVQSGLHACSLFGWPAFRGRAREMVTPCTVCLHAISSVALTGMDNPGGPVQSACVQYLWWREPWHQRDDQPLPSLPACSLFGRAGFTFTSSASYAALDCSIRAFCSSSAGPHGAFSGKRWRSHADGGGRWSRRRRWRRRRQRGSGGVLAGAEGWG